MEKTVLYVGNFFFPDGNAAGKRVHGNIKAMQEAGYNTACLCFRKNGIKDDAYLCSDKIDGTEVYTVPYCQGLDRMNNRKPMQAFRRVFSKVSRNAQIVAVVMYGTLGSTTFNLSVCKFAKKNGIRVLYDYVDLFDTQAKSNYLRYLIKKWDLKVMENRVLPACDGYITISSYLKNAVPKPSCAVIVPPLVVSVADKPAEAADHTITVAYASVITDKGRPVQEWKDRIDAMISAFYDLYTVHGVENFKLRFIGFTKKELLEMLEDHLRDAYEKKIKAVETKIEFLGPMSNVQTQKLIYDSDFTILLRDSKTSTNAGFPTKVSESVALGVPVITNVTSDIGSYIDDGENGFLVPPPDNHEALVNSLLRVFTLSKELRDQMKMRTLAGCRFHYTRFVQPLRSVVSGREETK
jgi:glycosyltransferase involved in cell wall biosynthesis